MSGLPPSLPPKPGSHQPSRHATPGVESPATLTPVSNIWEARVTQLDADTPSPKPNLDIIPNFIQNAPNSEIQSLINDDTLLSQIVQTASHTDPATETLRQTLLATLSHNATLSTQLTTLESKLRTDRAALASLLAHSRHLDGVFHANEPRVDGALEPFMPPALYKRLGQAVVEQKGICEALEESFLEGGRDENGNGEGEEGESKVGEREVAEWVRRYREARVVYWRRKEQRDRWDEGRVGGWR